MAFLDTAAGHFGREQVGTWEDTHQFASSTTGSRVALSFNVLPLGRHTSALVLFDVWLEQRPTMFLKTPYHLRPFDATSIWVFSIAKSLTKYLTKTRKLNVNDQVASDMNKIGIWFCSASGSDVRIRLSSAICPPHYPHWALLHFFLRKDLSDPINIVTLRMIILFTYHQH